MNRTTTHVLIGEHWGARGTTPVTNGTEFGIAPTNFTGNSVNGVNTVLAPKNGGGDLIFGDLIAIKEVGSIPYLITPSPADNIQSSYNANNAEMKFASFDAARGMVDCPPIRYDRIHRISHSPPRLRKPDIWVAHFGYNNGGTAPNNVYNGEELAITVSVKNGYPELPKLDFQANYIIGNDPPTGVPTTPVSNTEIQQAHFELLKQILDADKNEIYFDTNASLTLSAAYNYVCLFLVSKPKRIFELSEWDGENTPTINVSIRKNRGAFSQRNTILPSGNAFTNLESPGGFAAFNASLTPATFAPFIGKWVTLDPGSGYPSIVRHIERHYKGTRGHSNMPIWDSQPRTSVNPSAMYSEILLEYRSNIEQPGVNRNSSPLIRLYLFLAYTVDDEIVTPNNPIFNWYNLSNFPEPFATRILTGFNPPKTWGQFLAGTTGVSPGVLTNNFGALGGAYTALSAYTPSLLPAQTGANSLFYNWNASQPDGLVDTFIGSLMNTLHT